jgi:4-hydroxyphenylpyruvate dioxygenase
MAFRVKDAKAAHARALSLGATDVKSDVGEGELDIPVH